MAPSSPCALPGPCAGRPLEAQPAGTAQVIGRDGTRIMAATLTWRMQAEGAGTGWFFTMAFCKHMALDEGYVNDTNELNEYISDLVKDSKVDHEEMPAYSPTHQTDGIWTKDSEHLSNCDQTTHDEIVSLGIDSHGAAVNDRGGRS